MIMIRIISQNVRMRRMRNLSLNGKVMVVNVMVASLFVYKMSVLPAMSNSIYKKLEQICNDFIWNGRRPKIAMNKLQNPVALGGLNLVSFEAKDKALKLSWIKKLVNKDIIATMAYSSLSPILKENIWRCNLKKCDVKKLEFKSGIWQDILTYWCDYNFVDAVQSANEAVNQVLWFNSLLRIENKPYFFSKAYQEGLLTVGQLIDPQGNILSHEELRLFFGLDVMQCNMILSSIPYVWKKMMKEENLGFEEVIYSYDKLLKVKKPVSYMYKTLVTKKTLLTQTFLKWRENLSLPEGVTMIIF